MCIYPLGLLLLLYLAGLVIAKYLSVHMCSLKGEKMENNKLIGKIYETTDYSKFITDSLYRNVTRIQYLKMEADGEDKQLPLIEVNTTETGKLEILNDQDAFYAAMQLKLPVRYYQSFVAPNKRRKRLHHFFMNDVGIISLIDYVNGTFTK